METPSILSMKSGLVPEIIRVEKVEDSLLVSFSDGKCAVFSSALLYSTLCLTTALGQLDEEIESKRGAEYGRQRYMA